MNSGKIGFGVLYQIGRQYLINPSASNGLDLLAKLKNLARLNGIAVPEAGVEAGIRATAGEGAVTVATPVLAPTVAASGGAAAAGGASVGGGAVVGGVIVGVAVGTGIGWLLRVEHTYDQWVYDHLPTGIQEIIGPVDFSHDPNDSVGPRGFGDGGFITSGTQSLPYRIDFENAPTATAPAQFVTVTDQLDPNLDWSTFQFTSLGFGDNIIDVPAANGHFFQTAVPMTYNGETFDVQIQLSLDLATGLVTATFQSLNPETDLPPDALSGFLPPEDGTGRGEGFISYVVSPKPNLSTGTEIRNVAAIVFDGNAVITTDQVDDDDASKGTDPTKEDLLTIDAGAPTSTVTALPGVSGTSFTVNWSGQDDAGGSGIATYDVYENEDGGPSPSSKRTPLPHRRHSQVFQATPMVSTALPQTTSATNNRYPARLRQLRKWWMVERCSSILQPIRPTRRMARLPSPLRAPAQRGRG